MKKPAVVRGFCFLLIIAFASPFAPAARAASALGQIVAQQPAAVNDVPVRDHATLFSGDRLRTGAKGWARVQLPANEQLHLHAESEARVERRGERLAVLLDQGQVTLRTHGQNGLHVHSNALEIASPTGEDAVWDVTRLSDKLTRVAARRGRLEVRGLNQVIEVAAGQSVEVRTEFGPDFDPEARRRMQAKLEEDDDCRDLGAVIFAVSMGATIAVFVPLAAADDDPPVSVSGLAQASVRPP